MALAVLAVVFAISLGRMFPIHLVSEEPREFWAKVPTMPAINYLLTSWAGYLVVFSRAVFLVAYSLGDAGPLFTRVCAAAIIGLVAAFWTSDRLAIAVPQRTVRIGFALSLALLPLTNPYVGPLNAQWWLAIAALGLALARPKAIDYVFFSLVGFSGTAPLIVFPVFRDRRGLALIPAGLIQAYLFLTSGRHPFPLHIREPFVMVAMLLIVAVVVGRLLVPDSSVVRVLRSGVDRRRVHRDRGDRWRHAVPDDWCRGHKPRFFSVLSIPGTQARDRFRRLQGR